MDRDYPLESYRSRRFKCYPVSVGVVAIIVGNNGAVYNAVIFKPSLVSRKIAKTFYYRVVVKPVNRACGRGGKRVFNVVFARYRQTDVSCSSR